MTLRESCMVLSVNRAHVAARRDVMFVTDFTLAWLILCVDIDSMYVYVVSSVTCFSEAWMRKTFFYVNYFVAVVQLTCWDEVFRTHSVIYFILVYELIRTGRFQWINIIRVKCKLQWTGSLVSSLNQYFVFFSANPTIWM